MIWISNIRSLTRKLRRKFLLRARKRWKKEIKLINHPLFSFEIFPFPFWHFLFEEIKCKASRWMRRTFSIFREKGEEEKLLNSIDSFRFMWHTFIDLNCSYLFDAMMPKFIELIQFWSCLNIRWGSSFNWVMWQQSVCKFETSLHWIISYLSWNFSCTFVVKGIMSREIDIAQQNSSASFLKNLNQHENFANILGFAEVFSARVTQL